MQIITFTATAILLMFSASSLAAPPFGGEKDVQYSAKLWKAMDKANLVGEQATISHPYAGTPPHGDVLDTLYGHLKMRGNGTAPLIIKRNYRGTDLTPKQVANAPGQYLASVTVMYKREGYDPDNQNWFWAKYKPDGSLHTNPKDMKLAGKVAKGMNKGCIACHKAADGGDYVFGTNRIK